MEYKSPQNELIDSQNQLIDYFVKQPVYGKLKFKSEFVRPEWVIVVKERSIEELKIDARVFFTNGDINRAVYYTFIAVSREMMNAIKKVNYTPRMTTVVWKNKPNFDAWGIKARYFDECSYNFNRLIETTPGVGYIANEIEITQEGVHNDGAIDDDDDDNETTSIGDKPDPVDKFKRVIHADRYAPKFRNRRDLLKSCHPELPDRSFDSLILDSGDVELTPNIVNEAKINNDKVRDRLRPLYYRNVLQIEWIDFSQHVYQTNMGNDCYCEFIGRRGHPLQIRSTVRLGSVNDFYTGEYNVVNDVKVVLLRTPDELNVGKPLPTNAIAAMTFVGKGGFADNQLRFLTDHSFARTSKASFETTSHISLMNSCPFVSRSKMWTQELKGAHAQAYHAFPNIVDVRNQLIKKATEGQYTPKCKIHCMSSVEYEV